MAHFHPPTQNLNAVGYDTRLGAVGQTGSINNANRVYLTDAFVESGGAATWSVNTVHQYDTDFLLIVTPIPEGDFGGRLQGLEIGLGHFLYDGKDEPHYETKIDSNSTGLILLSQVIKI